MQEVIRRLRNTQRDMDWSVKRDILSEFAWSLHLSGYSEQFRYDVILSGIKGYEAQCSASDAGKTPLYRDRYWDRSGRRQKKLLGPTTWYRPADAVAFVPASPGRELASRIQEVVDKEGKCLNISVKVVETGGRSLRSQLVRTDLSGCLLPDCHLCDCSHTRRGCVYSGKCLICEENDMKVLYFGETGHNGHHRVNEHRNSIETNDGKNAFVKHLQMRHPERLSDPKAFSFKVEGTFNSCLDRQVREGVLITYGEADEIMNSKTEYHQPGVTRVVPTREVGR